MVEVPEASNVPPEVTVVLAVYNGEAFVDRAIRSIRSQTFQSWELICVDDGSTDETPRKLISHALEDPRIKIITQENKGPAMARCAAYIVGRGDFFILVDADDYVATDFLDSLMRDARRTGADAVACDWSVQEGQSERFYSFYGVHGIEAGQSMSGREAFALTFPWRMHGNCLWRADLIKKFGTAEGNAFNDFNADEYLSRALFLGSNKVFIGDAKYFHCNNGGSITRMPSMKMLKVLETNDRLLDLALANGASAQTIKQILSQKGQAHASLLRTFLFPLNDFSFSERQEAFAAVQSSQRRLEAELKREGQRLGWSQKEIYETIARERVKLMLEKHARPLARKIRRWLFSKKKSELTAT